MLPYGFCFSMCASFLSVLDLSSHIWTRYLWRFESNLLVLDQLEKRTDRSWERVLWLVLQQASHSWLFPISSGHPNSPGGWRPQHLDQRYLIKVRAVISDSAFRNTTSNKLRNYGHLARLAKWWYFDRFVKLRPI